MAVGADVSLEDRWPLRVYGGEIENVSVFRYLGSIISTDGCCHRDIKSRISSASRAMGALRRPVFADSNLSLPIKRVVFEACVVALLYGSECGVPFRRCVVALSVFYNTSIRGLTGISQRDAWEQYLSKSTIFQAWNGPNTGNISTRLEQRRLEWLGHVCRMPEHRSLRKWLFGSLLSRRPACGPQLRWRDLGLRNVRDNSWYPITPVRPEWRHFYTTQCDDEKPAKHIDCEICWRSIRRQANCNRHKCSAERALPVRLQAGSRQCSRCRRWLRSAGGRGGIAVHKSSIEQATSKTPLSSSEPEAVAVPRQSEMSSCSAHCSRCGRCCNSKRGFQLHRCAEACTFASNSQ